MKIFILLLITTLSFSQNKKTITFISADNLTITADTYIAHNLNAPFIVLFHQAGWSRGEYNEIAPKLNAMGFNCMAIDQRSGQEVNNVKNQTALEAISKKLPGQFIDAIPDIVAAVNYARSNFAKGKIIAWGSSYSSALVLNLAGSNQINVDAVMSFAPGEYFGRQGKTATFVQDGAQHITVPVFITSAKNELNNWQPIMNKVKENLQNFYLPDTDGNHGSRALWEKFDDHKGYWEAVEKFLKKIKSS